MSKKSLGKLSLLFGSLFFCLSILELLVRFEILPLPLLEGSHGLTEKWFRGELTGKAKKIDRFDPLLGWTLQENLRGVMLGSRKKAWEVNSNSRGQRGTKEYSLERDPSVERIVAVGDSFTFGECVDDPEAFTAQLEAMSPRREVLNLGVHGYGHDQQLLRLRTEGKRFRPDIVLLGFFRSDIGRNGLFFRDYAKPYFRKQDEDWVLSNVPVSSPDQLRSSFRLRSVNYMMAFSDGWFRGRKKKNDREVTLFLLREILDETKAMGASAIFVRLPWWDAPKETWKETETVFTEICEESDVVCLDPTLRFEAFLETQERIEDHFQCHYSPALYGLVAEEIHEALK